MDERFDAVRDGCNPLKLYRLNKYRKGAVVPVVRAVDGVWWVI